MVELVTNPGLDKSVLIRAGYGAQSVLDAVACWRGDGADVVSTWRVFHDGVIVQEPWSTFPPATVKVGDLFAVPASWKLPDTRKPCWKPPNAGAAEIVTGVALQTSNGVTHTYSYKSYVSPKYGGPIGPGPKYKGPIQPILDNNLEAYIAALGLDPTTAAGQAALNALNNAFAGSALFATGAVCAKDVVQALEAGVLAQVVQANVSPLNFCNEVRAAVKAATDATTPPKPEDTGVSTWTKVGIGATVVIAALGVVAFLERRAHVGKNPQDVVKRYRGHTYSTLYKPATGKWGFVVHGHDAYPARYDTKGEAQEAAHRVIDAMLGD